MTTPHFISPVNAGAIADALRKGKRLAAEFPKRCKCGNEYLTMEYFKRLPFAHRQSDEFATVEYRHCACKSTIGVIVHIFDLSKE